LAERVLAEFITQMVFHLRDAFPLETSLLDESTMLEMVKCGVDLAESYDITLEDEVECFLEQCLLLGQGFDTRLDWAAKILSDQSLTGFQKINLIDYHIIKASNKYVALT